MFWISHLKGFIIKLRMTFEKLPVCLFKLLVFMTYVPSVRIKYLSSWAIELIYSSEAFKSFLWKRLFSSYQTDWIGIITGPILQVKELNNN